MEALRQRAAASWKFDQACSAAHIASIARRRRRRLYTAAPARKKCTMRQQATACRQAPLCVCVCAPGRGRCYALSEARACRLGRLAEGRAFRSLAFLHPAVVYTSAAAAALTLRESWQTSIAARHRRLYMHIWQGGARVGECDLLCETESVRGGGGGGRRTQARTLSPTLPNSAAGFAALEKRHRERVFRNGGPFHQTLGLCKVLRFLFRLREKICGRRKWVAPCYCCCFRW